MRKTEAAEKGGKLGSKVAYGVKCGEPPAKVSIYWCIAKPATTLCIIDYPINAVRNIYIGTCS